MYRLNQNVQPNGWPSLKKCIFFHRDINEVKKALCEAVRKGIPVEQLSISKDIDFDFECGVAIKEDEVNT